MQVEQENTQPSSDQPGFDPSQTPTHTEGVAPEATPGIEVQVSPDKMSRPNVSNIGIKVSADKTLTPDVCDMLKKSSGNLVTLPYVI